MELDYYMNIDFFERSMAMNLKEAFPYPSDSIQATIEKFSEALSKLSM